MFIIIIKKKKKERKCFSLLERACKEADLKREQPGERKGRARPPTRNERNRPRPPFRSAMAVEHGRAHSPDRRGRASAVSSASFGHSAPPNRRPPLVRCLRRRKRRRRRRPRRHGRPRPEAPPAAASGSDGSETCPEQTELLSPGGGGGDGVVAWRRGAVAWERVVARPADTAPPRPRVGRSSAPPANHHVLSATELG